MSNAKFFAALGCTSALLLLAAPGRAGNFTTAARQGSGYWDSGTDGSSGIWAAGAHTASGALAADPTATFEVLIPGARLRTTDPANQSLYDVVTAPSLVFPGTAANTLTVDGDGVYRNGAASTDPIAEIRFKYPNVTFPKLIMNGGTWDQGDTTSTNSITQITGVVYVHGEVNVNGVNFPIYNDGGADRGFVLDYLTGSGSIEYRAYTDVSTFKNGNKNGFVLLGETNTFCGKWNVVLGTLLGYGTNSLGTNSITVGDGAALETSYDVLNPLGNLILNGRLFLHQSNTFYNVVIGGTNVLAPGLYAAADLNTAYSNNFPATWTQHLPSAATANSGYLYVITNNIVVFVQHPATNFLAAGPFPETANFSAAAIGQAPIFYKWQRGTNTIGNFTNINDGGRISGTTTTSLSISNVMLADAGFYRCLASNSVGTALSFAAQLQVVGQGAASNFTMTANEPLGSDWDTPNVWSYPTSATYLAIVYPLSTFEVLPGGNLRTPNASLDATFPIYAGSLQMDGDGVFANPAGVNTGTLQFKNQSNGRVTFNKLVMNGGQLNAGQDNSYVIIAGEMDILTNTPIFEPNDSGNGDRGFRIDAWLTGTGTIEARLHTPGTFTGHDYVQCLNVTGASNTFSGQWNIVNGVVLGSGTNSLGTNNIIVADDFAGNGALETLYDIYNPNSSLIIAGAMNLGQVYLHQNDAFMAVSIGGLYLTNGTYDATLLNTLYPANFPTTWLKQTGSTTNMASGSITVLGVPLTIQSAGTNVIVNWPFGTLLEAPTPLGPWATNNATAPFTNAPTGPAKFYRVQIQ